MKRYQLIDSIIENEILVWAIIDNDNQEGRGREGEVYLALLPLTFLVSFTTLQTNL